MKTRNMLVFLFLPFFAMAQTENAKALKISYYGDFFSHPGIKIGYELPLRYRLKTKEKKGVDRPKHKFQLLELATTFYYHPGNHYGLLLIPSYTFRTVKENGKKQDWSIGLGYHRSFLTGPTYSMDQEGDFIIQKGAGQNTVFASLTYAFGRDYRWTKQKPWAWDIAFGVNARAPYNSSVLFGIHTHLGVSYFLNY